MLLNDDVVADGKPEPSSFSRRLSRKKRVEHPFFHVRRNAGAVVADSDFHPIANIFGLGGLRRLVIAIIGRSSALGRSIKAIRNQIKKSAPDVLRENVCSTGSRIKELLELDLKTLRFSSRSVPCEIEAFLNERVYVKHPMLT